MIARGFVYAAPSSRVRARVGTLLTKREYGALVRAASDEELVAELRATTYARAVDTAEPSASFADTLRQHYLASIERIVVLLPHAARDICRAFLARWTIDALKVVLRSAGSTVERPRYARLLGPLPDSDLPVERLIGAATLQEVVDALSETPYAEPLRAAARRRLPGAPSAAEMLLDVEVELDKWFFANLWRTARSLPVVDARIARRLAGVFADVANLLWVRRLRDTFHLAPDEVARRLIPYGHFLTLRGRRALALEGVERPLVFPFAESRTPTVDLRVRSLRVLCREASRPLFMVPFQAGLPLAYLLLAEAEVCDLVTLYEGKRWGVAPQALAQRLIRFHGEALTQGP